MLEESIFLKDKRKGTLGSPGALQQALGQLQAGISLKDSVKRGIRCGSWTACLGSWSKCQGINRAWGKVNLK